MWPQKLNKLDDRKKFYSKKGEQESKVKRMQISILYTSVTKMKKEHDKRCK